MRETARRSGITVQTISLVAADERDISVSKLLRICKVLDCTLVEFFGPLPGAACGMTLEDKRRVIEVLLCGPDAGVTTDRLSHVIHCDAEVAAAAGAAWWDVDCRLYELWADDSIEAAYRLIESSPTLRREWFGAP